MEQQPTSDFNEEDIKQKLKEEQEKIERLRRQAEIRGFIKTLIIWFIRAVVIYFCWNYLNDKLVSFSDITFYDAVVLLVLSLMLFGFRIKQS